MSDIILKNAPYPNLDIDAVIDTTLLTLSKSSARIYSQTYQNWLTWCEDLDVHPFDLRPQVVYAFLVDQPVTIATRKRHLSAFRKLARVLALDLKHPEFKTLYEGLRLLKAPTEEVAGEERTRRALRPQQVWKILEVWDGDSPLEARNKALLSVLFYTGMRRAEVIALKWSDVDWDAGIIRVRHGKGDKYREVAMVAGRDDPAHTALSHWYTIQLANSSDKRDYIFCGLRKGGKLREDKPIHQRAVNQIIDETVKQSGIAFTTHDARRTLGTDLLGSNHPLADVQAQLGHKHASTTLQHYALPADARKRRGKMKTSY
ncbi:MAG: site-specific integrase [Chloroflexota bacterium]